MVSPQAFFVQQEVRKVQNRLDAAASQINRATNVQDVVRHQDVHVPAWLRTVVARERNALHATAERKAGALIERLLQRVHESSGAARTDLIHQLQQAETALRGRFPRLAYQTQQFLLAARRTAENSRDPSTASDLSEAAETADVLHRGPSHTG